jgi:hypothetical protein
MRMLLLQFRACPATLTSAQPTAGIVRQVVLEIDSYTVSQETLRLLWSEDPCPLVRTYKIN